MVCGCCRLLTASVLTYMNASNVFEARLVWGSLGQSSHCAFFASQCYWASIHEDDDAAESRSLNVRVLLEWLSWRRRCLRVLGATVRGWTKCVWRRFTTWPWRYGDYVALDTSLMRQACREVGERRARWQSPPHRQSAASAPDELFDHALQNEEDTGRYKETADMFYITTHASIHFHW